MRGPARALEWDLRDGTYGMEMLDLLEASLPKKVRLRIVHGAQLPPIFADSAQLQQVFLNLLTNAGGAIGEEVGEIVVCTGIVRRGDAAQDEVGLGDEQLDAPVVYIEVTDTEARRPHTARQLARMLP